MFNRSAKQGIPHRLLGVILLMSALVSMPSLASVELTFGLYTSDKPSVMVKQFSPVLRALEKRLSADLHDTVSIHLQVANSYEKGLADLVQGRVDFSRMGPASYISAKTQEPQLQLLAMESQKGAREFYGIICVAKDSAITELSQLKGQSFAFGNESSTIGRYLSQLYLRQHGITASDLSEFSYLGRHDKVGMAVATGQYAAGALKESTFNKLRKKGVAIKELARFANVTKPWIARKGLQPELIAALRKALLAIDDEKALKALKKAGFLSAEDAHYQSIRQALAESSLFMQKP